MPHHAVRQEGTTIPPGILPSQVVLLPSEQNVQFGLEAPNLASNLRAKPLTTYCSSRSRPLCRSNCSRFFLCSAFFWHLTTRCQIVHGKAVYHLPGVLPDQSVLDIKRRLEPLTGVLFIRQKLVYKGILRDADLISATKVVEGARVMLLGTPATKK